MVKLEFTKKQIEMMHECAEYMLNDKQHNLAWVKENKETYILETPREISNEVKVIQNIIIKLQENA
tara:strand:- start:1631 stop:1828 length:198 start_codon:yes stop_codon:yes gene_type:complete